MRKVFCILNLVLYFLKIAEDVRLRHHGVIGVINDEDPVLLPFRFAQVSFKV